MITVYLCMHNTNSSSIDAHVNLGGHVCLWFCALCAHCAHFVYFVHILCFLCKLCKFCAFCASVHMRTCSPYQPRTIHTSKNQDVTSAKFMCCSLMWAVWNQQGWKSLWHEAAHEPEASWDTLLCDFNCKLVTTLLVWWNMSKMW